ncbi:MAG: DNA integrity scanning protein DisA nucleotide-binding domain protein, partial [Polyangia bacterium]|nr:DNA integrity scanning protein DisA nucleotide-binding domain protein [Polyangia bacterium]
GTELERSLGTRHRAAIGITEETDAVAVVVSEVRGSISICQGGRILQNVGADDLRSTLIETFRRPRATGVLKVVPAGEPSQQARKGDSLGAGETGKVEGKEDHATAGAGGDAGSKG